MIRLSLLPVRLGAQARLPVRSASSKLLQEVAQDLLSGSGDGTRYPLDEELAEYPMTPAFLLESETLEDLVDLSGMGQGIS